MGTAIVTGHYLDIPMARSAVAIFVVDASVGKVDLLVIVRKATLSGPERNLLRFPIRPAIAVLPSAVALLKKPLIVAFELVVEHCCGRFRFGPFGR
jgi:hypothetical protein